MDDNPYASPGGWSEEATHRHRMGWVSGVCLLGIVALFATLPFMLALLALLACDVVAFVVLSVVGLRDAANLSFLAGVLTTATLKYTEWGLSSLHPQIHVAWWWLVSAGICHGVLICLPMWAERQRDGKQGR